MSEETKNEYEPVEGSQQPEEVQPEPTQPNTQPTLGIWSAPQNRATGPDDIARRLRDAGSHPTKPLEAISPETNMADLLSRMMAPPEDSMVQIEPPMMFEGEGLMMDHPTMMRPRTVQQRVLMACPSGTVGMCLACQHFPCLALKSKVLEVCSMDYRAQMSAPKT